MKEIYYGFDRGNIQTSESDQCLKNIKVKNANGWLDEALNL